MTPEDSQNIADIRAYLAALYERSGASSQGESDATLKSILSAIQHMQQQLDTRADDVRRTHALLRVYLLCILISTTLVALCIAIFSFTIEDYITGIIALTALVILIISIFKAISASAPAPVIMPKVPKVLPSGPVKKTRAR